MARHDKLGFVNGPMDRRHDLHHLQDVNPTKLYLTPRALVDHLQPFTAIGNSLIVNGIYSEMLSTSVNGVNRANGPLDHLQSVDCQWQ